MNEFPEKPAKKDLYRYFRMGLVTGLVDKQDVVDWADREILQTPLPEIEVIELSVSGKLSYSQLVGTLFDLQGEPNYDLTLKMLFARAGMILEEDPGQAADLLLGLRLLKAEEFLSKEVKARLTGLEGDLDLYQRQEIHLEELAGRLSRFLQPYCQYRPLLEQDD